MIELAGILERIASKKLTYHLIDYPDSYPQDEPMRRSPERRKARLQLGFKPTVNLEDGLSKFLAWSKEVYTGS